MVRLSELPPVGAVAVGGGVVKDRVPRLPMLRPRPPRASASLATSTRAVRMANNAITGRNRRTCIMVGSQAPLRRSLYWYVSADFEVPSVTFLWGAGMSIRALVAMGAIFAVLAAAAEAQQNTSGGRV